MVNNSCLGKHFKQLFVIYKDLAEPSRDGLIINY